MIEDVNEGEGWNGEDKYEWDKLNGWIDGCWISDRWRGEEGNWREWEGKWERKYGSERWRKEEKGWNGGWRLMIWWMNWEYECEWVKKRGDILREFE